MPMGRLSGDRCPTASPAIFTSPASGRSNPATRRSVVVLPHPEGPRRLKNSPLSTFRLTSRTAQACPYRLLTPSSSTTAHSYPASVRNAIPFLAVSFVQDRSRPPDSERALAKGQEGQGPYREGPLPGRLPRKRGLTAKRIAKITLNTPCWVQETLQPKLTPEERERVLGQPRRGYLGALQGPSPDGGLWTGPKLRDWVEGELGKRLSLYPIYRLLHEMGFALRVSRPRHARADRVAGEAFKKTSSPRLRRRGPRGGG